MEQYWREQNLGWFTGFDLMPFGSFPCDNKVGDIDEFDFLCVLHLPKDCITGRETGYRDVRAPNQRLGETIDWHIQPLCRKILQDLIMKTKEKACTSPRVRDVFKHGPATCIELEWVCVDHHTHTVGIDITLAVEVTDPAIDFHVYSVWNRKGMFGQGFIVNEARYPFVYSTAGESWQLSSAFFDLWFFTEMTRRSRSPPAREEHLPVFEDSHQTNPTSEDCRGCGERVRVLSG